MYVDFNHVIFFSSFSSHSETCVQFSEICIFFGVLDIDHFLVGVISMALQQIESLSKSQLARA